MGIWSWYRSRSLKRLKLVNMMNAKNSEVLGIYAVSTLFALDKEDKTRLKILAKHIRWLRRIYAGMWPWGLDI